MRIVVTNLLFRYGDAVVLNDISFAVEPGEHLALVGHNGSGKTSLAKHLNGLLQPASGRVMIGDVNTARERTSRLAGKVALSFQNPDDQICKRKVSDEIAFGPKNLGYRQEWRTTGVCRALRLFDLELLQDLNPYDLGYSERKRVALASTLAMDTPILVFDEPTAGLDPKEVGLFKNALALLRQESKTVIVISHDMELVAEFFPRMLCLENGALRFDGPPREGFLNQQLLSGCGLLPPQIVRVGMCLGHTEPALTAARFLDNLVPI